MGLLAGLHAYPVCRYSFMAGIAVMLAIGLVCMVWVDFGTGVFLWLLGGAGLIVLAAAFNSHRRFQADLLASQILAYVRTHDPSSFRLNEVKAAHRVPDRVRELAVREAYARCYRTVIFRGGPTAAEKQQLSGFAKALGLSHDEQRDAEDSEDRAALTRDTRLLRNIAAVLKASPTALNADQVARHLKTDFDHQDVTAAKVRSLMEIPLRHRVFADELDDGVLMFTKRASFRELADRNPSSVREATVGSAPSKSSGTDFAEFLRPAIPEEVRQATRSTDADDIRTEALRGTVGAEDHLLYALCLLDKYDWDHQSRQKIASLIDEIEARKQDPRLFLGVVGEFSSGKSTFINALIRDDLLQTDVLQGTTAAATVLSYAGEPDVEVLFHDGILCHAFMDWVRPSPEVSEKEAMRQFVRRFTAEESVAQNVATVSVLHPAEAFRRGLVIVDTPGTNAENPRHVKVAGQALRRICDAAIVVIPADVPGSQTLMAFLKQHLADVLHRCVFILNKMDVVRRPREEERLLKTVTAVVRRELGLESPVVLPAAPQSVLDEIGTDEPAEEGTKGHVRVEQFKRTERDLYDFLEANKDVVLLERLSLCLSTLLTQLQIQLRDSASAYQRRREALDRNRIQDLAAFVSGQKHKHLGEFRLRTDEITGTFPQAVRDHRDSVLAAVRRDVGKATSTSALKSVVENDTVRYMSWAQEQLQQVLLATRLSVRRAAEDEHAKFKTEFASLYRSLATLDGTVSVSGVTLPSSLSLAAQIGGHTQTLAKNLRSTLEQGFASVGIGAAIGTAILPGIGTAVGGFIGAALAGIFGPSLDEQRQKVLTDVSAAIRDSFNTFEGAAVRNLDSTVKQVGASLSGIIERYFAVYESTVEELTRRVEAEKVRLEKTQAIIEGDLGELESRLVGLARIRKQMREACV